MTEVDSVKFLFVIDTDKYSGNFEREMCAFMTGEVGQCDVGRQEADDFEKEFPESEMHEYVMRQPDDNGCMRPATIWPTPGLLNDGYGNHYPESEASEDAEAFPAYQSVGIWMSLRPTADMIAFLKERAYAFLKRPARRDWQQDDMPTKITGFRLVTFVTIETEQQL